MTKVVISLGPFSFTVGIDFPQEPPAPDPRSVDQAVQEAVNAANRADQAASRAEAAAQKAEAK